MMEGTPSTHISNEGGVAVAQAGSRSRVWGEGRYVLQNECVSGISGEKKKRITPPSRVWGEGGGRGTRRS